MEPFIGQLMCVGFNFAPRGWALCNGQLMSIAQNTALFSLLGTMYGGDGVTTFALPDLRGRAALHNGQGPGLSVYTQGQVGGNENVTLIASQMPMHNHTAACSSTDPSDTTPVGGVPAAGGSYATTANSTMLPTMIGMAGGSQPHPNMQPFLVLNWIIALEGVFPSRS
ncbi:MAG: phage tail protein [Bryobacterales bacterium]|nr:phage tail protein [Bryobacterales bacterium]